MLKNHKISKSFLVMLAVLAAFLCMTLPAMASTIEISKDVTPTLPNVYRIGDVITYEVTIENPSVFLTNDITRVVDFLPNGDEKELIDSTLTLGPGESESFDVTYTVAEIDLVEHAPNMFSVLNIFEVFGIDDAFPIRDSAFGHAEKSSLVIKPDIELMKYVNDFDANIPTGPLIPVGGATIFKYWVHNNGNTVLGNVEVWDDVLGKVSFDTTLAPGESKNFFAAGVAIDGPYSNNATATGDPYFGQYQIGSGVEDDDPAHYLGTPATVEILKSVNGLPADTPTGPEIPVGGDALFNFVVTNPGPFNLENVAVNDTSYGAIWIIGDLAANDSTELALPKIAVAGQHANTATVTGNVVGTQVPVEDDDPTHYLGRTDEPEGFTPGFWKNHTESWENYSTDTTLGAVFDTTATENLGMANKTLLEALNFGGGRGETGAARILFRAAVAALLNADHPEINYPRTESQIIDAVNTALASDRHAMLSLASQLDTDNNIGGDINP